jgi:zinc transporter ZupT
MIPFGGGLLVGVSLFGMLPELASEGARWGGLLLFAAGYAALWVVNRLVYPVCPSCAHDHDHTGCEMPLHGFTGPLVAAAIIHSFLDGWSIVTAERATLVSMRLALPLAVVLHKIPEGMALGAILHASVSTRRAALAWCLLAQAPTLAGGAVGRLLTPRLASVWVSYPLAGAGGFLFYLGFHAVHGEWKRRGARAAFTPALAGAAGAAVLQQGARVLFG